MRHVCYTFSIAQSSAQVNTCSAARGFVETYRRRVFLCVAQKPVFRRSRPPGLNDSTMQGAVARFCGRTCQGTLANWVLTFVQNRSTLEFIHNEGLAWYTGTDFAQGGVRHHAHREDFAR